MQRFKKIGLWLLIASSLLVVISLVLPSEVQVERSIVINAPKSTIYAQINRPANWVHWSPWYEKDTNARISYFGPEEGNQSGYNWSSRNSEVGTGKLTIRKSLNNDSIYTQLDFMENGSAEASFAFTPEGAATKMVWSFTCNMSKPFIIGKYLGLFMDKMIGSDFEKGLTNLKAYTEKIAASSNSDIKLAYINIPEQPFLSVHVNCKPTEIAAKLGESYGLITEWIKKNDMKMAGSPLAIYHRYDASAVVDMEPAIPVTAAKAGSDQVQKGIIKAQMVVVADYYGDYEKSSIAHDAINKWITDNGKKITGSPWEQYITDPMMETDTAKWLTKIYYPVN